jgi:hypothetical protein
MSWTPILLSDPSPSLRVLVLKELLGRSEDDPEVQELKVLQTEDPILLRFLDLQNGDGSFRALDAGGGILGKIRLTAQALMGLGYIGLIKKHPAIQKGAEYIFSKQLSDGSFPLSVKGNLLDGGELDQSAKYHMIPLQTALPLLGLAWSGFATDPRSERAYEWLLKEELEEGGWPSGRHFDQYIFAGGYRRLAHSKFGCRTNTTAVISALALHPARCNDPSAQRGIDLLLAHEQRQAHTLGFEVARLIGFEPPRGGFTYFRRYDIAQMLDLSWRIGVSLEDERLAQNVDFIKSLQGPYGLWKYDRFPEITRWISFDILRSLSKLEDSGDWLSMEPRTKFQPYPKKEKRF